MCVGVLNEYWLSWGFPALWHDVRLTQGSKITDLDSLWNIDREEIAHFCFPRLLYTCETEVFEDPLVFRSLMNYSWLLEWQKLRWKRRLEIRNLHLAPTCVMVSHVTFWIQEVSPLSKQQSRKNRDECRIRSSVPHTWAQPFRIPGAVALRRFPRFLPPAVFFVTNLSDWPGQSEWFI